MAVGITNAGGGASIKQIIPLEVTWTPVVGASIDISSYNIDESKTIVFLEGGGVSNVDTWDDNDNPVSLIIPIKPISHFTTVGATHSLVIEPGANRYYGSGGWANQISVIPGFTQQINVTLIEYHSGIKSLQRGIVPQPYGYPESNVTIGEVDPDKSLVIIDGYIYSWSKRALSQAYEWREWELKGKLTNSTSLNISTYPMYAFSAISHYYNSVYYNLNGGNYSYQVIEFY